MATKPTSKGRFSKRAVAHAKGFRSGFEDEQSADFKAAGVIAGYERLSIKYPPPKEFHTYTPDWDLPNGIVLESKGFFEASDRTKHLTIKKAHPDLEIRFIFERPQTRLSKSSKTTYAAWAEKHGFKWAARRCPKEWVDEPINKKWLAAIARAETWPPKET